MSQRKEYYEFKKKRVAEAIRRDPEITNEMIRERFGITKTLIDKIRTELNIPAPGPDALHEIRKDCKTPERFSISKYRSGK